MLLLASLLSLLQAQAPITGTGTYVVAVCAQQCDGSDNSAARARGTLTLDSTTVQVSFGPVGSLGCFDIAPRSSLEARAAHRLHHYTSWTSWHTDPGIDSLVFFASVSYSDWRFVKVLVTESGFVGLAHSGGIDGLPIHSSDEFVIARRIGPPDHTLCHVAADGRPSAEWPSVLLFIAGSPGMAAFILHQH
jgi:hypothetical protein